MKYNNTKYKYLSILILPFLWLLYFSFELITGRITDLFSLIMNLSLLFVFAFVGFIIYKLSTSYSKGITTRKLLIIFTILMIIDQGSKLIINNFFFNEYFEIIPDFLSFHPIINTDGSWLNARFGAGIGFPVLIVINFLAIFIFIELYRYSKYKKLQCFDIDMCFSFITAGALCSLIDKVFYGGSLDFIGISNLFIADIKDIYINLGILFFILAMYKNDFLNEEDETTLKDDWQSIKRFGSFIYSDIKKKGKE